MDFDAYLMVDWSASSVKKTGPDSIWYCLLVWEKGRPVCRALKNPATRVQARIEIADILVEMAARRLSVLVGFDFAYGYPSGFSPALGLGDRQLWRAVWEEIRRRISDHADNCNNRFEVAAALNDKLSGQPFPFGAVLRVSSVPLYAVRSPRSSCTPRMIRKSIA